MKNTKHFTRWLIIFTALVAVCAVGVYFFVLRHSDAAKISDAPIEVKPQSKALSISALVVKSKPMVEEITATATLNADETVQLSFESSGRITELNIDEGQKVKKGTLVAKINDSELQAQLAKLKIQHKLAQDRELRQRSLLEREAISRESYEQSLTDVQTLKADIMQLESKIEKSSVFAPFDGVVGLRYLSEGAFVQPGATIAQMVKITPLKIDFSIPEKYAGVVKVGTPLQFTVEGYNKTFSAKIYAIEPQINTQTHMLAMRALYPNANEELRPGILCRVSLQIRLFPNAITIPSEALIPEMDGAKVFLYKDGKAMPTPVTIGIRTETEVQIAQGIQHGDTLITSGMLQLRYGMPVVINNF
jgi:membrane fusion protein (multidrug efflux system)